MSIKIPFSFVHEDSRIYQAFRRLIDSLSSVVAPIDLFLGNGALGNVVIDTDTSICGVNDYENFTINAGATVTLCPNRILVIRARNKVIINGKIDGKGAIKSATDVVLCAGSSVSSPSGGGGGGGNGVNGFGNWGQTNYGWNSGGPVLGYSIPNFGNIGIGGHNGSPGEDGGDGTPSSPGTILSSLFDCFKLYPGSFALGFISGGIPGIYGEKGGTGGNWSGLIPTINGGEGGNGGIGGYGGGGIIIVAPIIEFGSSSIIDTNGLDGGNASVGNSGDSAPVLSQAGGGGGGGGGSGGQGGSGGFLITYHGILTDNGLTFTANPGNGGASANGGAGGIGDTANGGFNGGKGGKGATGPSGSIGFASYNKVF